MDRSAAFLNRASSFESAFSIIARTLGLLCLERLSITTTSPGAQLGQQHLLDVSLERKAVDGPVDDKGGDEAAHRQSAYEGCRFPMTMRDADPQAFSYAASTVAARHVGGSPGLIDKNETFQIKVKLAVEPVLPPLQDVRSVLLRGHAHSFLRVMLCRLRNAGSSRSRRRDPDPPDCGVPLAR